MMSHFSLPVLLILNTILIGAHLAYAAEPKNQQIPPQHSPSIQNLQVIHAENLRSQVKLSWSKTPKATHYLLRVSKNPEMTQVIYASEFSTTSATTPELDPGAYYYTIEALTVNEIIARSKPKRLVVGSPLSLEGIRDPLPAVTLLEPPSMQEFKTDSKVRLAWKPVRGAIGYKVELYYEGKNESESFIYRSKSIPPRWVTEVKQPFLSIHDAPYSSFIYPDTGVYRWEVTPINKETGKLGLVSVSRFVINRQLHLNPEIYIRANYNLSPNAYYRQESAVQHTSLHLSSTIAHHINSDFDWWLSRRWGVYLAGGIEILPIQPAGYSEVLSTTTFYNVSGMAQHRFYLSRRPHGWKLSLRLGIGAQEFSQIDTIAPIHIIHPVVVGPRLGFMFDTSWRSGWSIEFGANALIHTFLVNGEVDNDELNLSTLDGDIYFRVYRVFSDLLSVGLGLNGEYKRLLHYPNNSVDSSHVLFSNYFYSLNFRFHL